MFITLKPGSDRKKVSDMRSQLSSQTHLEQEKGLAPPDINCSPQATQGPRG